MFPPAALGNPAAPRLHTTMPVRSSGVADVRAVGWLAPLTAVGTEWPAGCRMLWRVPRMRRGMPQRQRDPAHSLAARCTAVKPSRTLSVAAASLGLLVRACVQVQSGVRAGAAQHGGTACWEFPRYRNMEIPFALDRCLSWAALLAGPVRPCTLQTLPLRRAPRCTETPRSAA
jgi:hypothetical protein